MFKVTVYLIKNHAEMDGQSKDIIIHFFNSVQEASAYILGMNEALYYSDWKAKIVQGWE